MSTLFSEQRLEHLRSSRAEVSPAARVSLLLSAEGLGLGPSAGRPRRQLALGSRALGGARPRQLGPFMGGPGFPGFWKLRTLRSVGDPRLQGRTPQDHLQRRGSLNARVMLNPGHPQFWNPPCPCPSASWPKGAGLSARPGTDDPRYPERGLLAQPAHEQAGMSSHGDGVHSEWSQPSGALMGPHRKGWP